MRILVTALCIAGAAAAAVAEEKQVPQEFATIQAAVEAAAEGDVVVVSDGTYTEAVVAAKSNITIQGNGAVWNCGEGSGLTLTGDGNVVAGFRFEGGTDQVVCNGNDVEITHCKSADASGSFAVITGANATITSCKVEDTGGNGIEISGSGAVLSHVKLDACAGDGILIVGADATVTSCKAEDTGDDGIQISGSGAVVTRTKLAACGGTGISVDGDGAVILSCKVTGAEDGGVEMEGDDTSCSRTKVMLSGSFGFSLDGDVGTMDRCIALRSGSAGGAGFVITGSTNEISLCKAIQCTDDGFQISGDANVATRDTASNCEEDGFDIQFGVGVVLDSCRSVNNGEEGVENGGTMTDCTDCRLVSNETDIALDSSLGASYDDTSSTTFVTGDVTLIIEGD